MSQIDFLQCIEHLARVIELETGASEFVVTVNPRLWPYVEAAARELGCDKPCEPGQRARFRFEKDQLAPRGWLYVRSVDEWSRGQQPLFGGA